MKFEHRTLPIGWEWFNKNSLAPNQDFGQNCFFKKKHSYISNIFHENKKWTQKKREILIFEIKISPRKNNIFHPFFFWRSALLLNRSFPGSFYPSDNFLIPPYDHTWFEKSWFSSFFAKIQDLSLRKITIFETKYDHRGYQEIIGWIKTPRKWTIQK